LEISVCGKPWYFHELQHNNNEITPATPTQQHNNNNNHKNAFEFISSLV
jgi:hypothetical protein